MKNGRIPETGRVVETKTATVAAIAVQQPVDRGMKDAVCRSSNEQYLDSTGFQPALYTKERETDGKVDGLSPSTFLKASGTANETPAGDVASRFSLEGDHDRDKQRHSDSVSQGGWSPVDDQEWLFLHSKHLPSKPNVKTEENRGTFQVWAEVLHLPSVDMYALPYVVPL
eukprot:c25247_g3_i1 orf=2251-2760(+)